VRETGFDLDRLAEESGIGRKRLAALYREACFEGIGKMLREQRCLVARQWLRRLLSVKEAATRAGYRHATQFIADFRSVYGTTPGAFRKSLRDGNEWSWTPEFRRSRRARLLAAARGRLANPSNGRRRPNP
jgi:AraC-like DNA-binding protein